MRELSWKAAVDVVGALRDEARIASSTDARWRNGRMFPAIRPTFRLKSGDSVFTIGSCFARNIEEKLDGFDLPTRRFSAPLDECAGTIRPNALLNEYNPGAIRQRISRACKGEPTGEASLVFGMDGVTDLLLPGGTKPTTLNRAVARRAEIDAIYSALPNADAVIITLGLVEAWYDHASSAYLNGMPSMGAWKADRERFSLRILDASDAVAELEPAIVALVEKGVSRILLTVSPVPLDTSFSGSDCYVGNNYSKSVLCICANEIARRFPEVDYFPSYEIVMSSGAESFIEDRQHVRDQVVGEVINYMKALYLDA